MCNLKQEEFLNIRFKENEIERECWAEALNKLSKGNEDRSLIPSTMHEIALRKREIYQAHLECEVEKQKTEFEKDESLRKLREAHDKFKSGEYTHAQYWINVDTILCNINNKRDYILINNEWVRNTNE